MFFLALVIGVAQTQSPVVLHSRVVSAAVFKPGLAMLVREVEVPAGSGFYALDALPNAIDGSFWFDSPDSATVSGVETTIRLQDDTQIYEAKTVAEMIYANVGKRVSIVITKWNNEPETVAGLVSNLDEHDGSMVLKTDEGKLRVLSISQIVGINSTGLATTYTRKGKTPTLHVQFKATAAKPAHIRFTSFEPGATWNASYLVNLGSDGAGRVEGKAQLGLGGLKFENTDTKLMAGFPNLPSGPKFDLASGYGSLESYLHTGQNNFVQTRPVVADPYDLFAAWIQEMQASLGRFTIGQPMSGGFGGRGAFDFDYNRGAIFAGTTNGSFIGREGGAGSLPSDTSIFRTESLYAYPIGSTTLEPGDRLTKLLFAQPSHYRTIYRWDAIDGGNPVEEFLRVHNDGKTPWTGGIATITKIGIPLAQTDMPFTAPGHDADLDLGKAPDIITDKDVRETKAEPIPDPSLKPGDTRRVRLTEETRMSATNTKSEPITVEVILTLPGDVTAPGATTVKTPRRYGDLNAKVRLTWTLQLAPGEQKRILATNIYVR